MHFITIRVLSSPVDWVQLPLFLFSLFLFISFPKFLAEKSPRPNHSQKERKGIAFFFVVRSSLYCSESHPNQPTEPVPYYIPFVAGGYSKRCCIAPTAITYQPPALSSPGDFNKPAPCRPNTPREMPAPAGAQALISIVSVLITTVESQVAAHSSS